MIKEFMDKLNDVESNSVDLGVMEINKGKKEKAPKAVEEDESGEEGAEDEESGEDIKTEIFKKALEKAGYESDDESVEALISDLASNGMEIEIGEDADKDEIIKTLSDYISGIEDEEESEEHKEHEASESDEEEKEEHMGESVKSKKGRLMNESITYGTDKKSLLDVETIAIPARYLTYLVHYFPAGFEKNSEWAENSTQNMKPLTMSNMTRSEKWGDQRCTCDLTYNNKTYKEFICAGQNGDDLITIWFSQSAGGEPLLTAIVEDILKGVTNLKALPKVDINDLSKSGATRITVSAKNLQITPKKSQPSNEKDDDYSYDGANESVKSKKKKIIKENKMANFGIAQVDKLSRSLGALEGLLDSVKDEKTKAKFNKIYGDLNSIITDLSNEEKAEELPMETPMDEELPVEPEVVTEPTDDEVSMEPEATEEIPAVEPEEEEETVATESVRRKKTSTISESANNVLNSLDWIE